MKKKDSRTKDGRHCLIEKRQHIAGREKVTDLARTEVFKTEATLQQPTERLSVQTYPPTLKSCFMLHGRNVPLEGMARTQSGSRLEKRFRRLRPGAVRCETIRQNSLRHSNTSTTSSYLNFRCFSTTRHLRTTAPAIDIRRPYWDCSCKSLTSLVLVKCSKKMTLLTSPHLLELTMVSE